jgi:hypothetical protein
VRDFNHINVEIIVGEDGAADGSYSDGSAAYSEFVDGFCDEPMGNTVTATRTIVRRDIL